MDKSIYEKFERIKGRMNELKSKIDQIDIKRGELFDKYRKMGCKLLNIGARIRELEKRENEKNI